MHIHRYIFAGQRKRRTINLPEVNILTGIIFVTTEISGRRATRHGQNFKFGNCVSLFSGLSQCEQVFRLGEQKCEDEDTFPVFSQSRKQERTNKALLTTPWNKETVSFSNCCIRYTLLFPAVKLQGRTSNYRESFLPNNLGTFLVVMKLNCVSVLILHHNGWGAQNQI